MDTRLRQGTDPRPADLIDIVSSVNRALLADRENSQRRPVPIVIRPIEIVAVAQELKLREHW